MVWLIDAPVFFWCFHRHQHRFPSGIRPKPFHHFHHGMIFFAIVAKLSQVDPGEFPSLSVMRDEHFPFPTLGSLGFRNPPFFIIKVHPEYPIIRARKPFCLGGMFDLPLCQ